MKKQQIDQEKTVWVNQRKITVGDKNPVLLVRLTFDALKGTFKVKADITTNHVSSTNPDLTNATLQQLIEMIKECVEKAFELREQLNQETEEQTLF